MKKENEESLLEEIVSIEYFKERKMSCNLVIKIPQIYSFVNDKEGYVAQKIGRKYKIIGYWRYH